MKLSKAARLRLFKHGGSAVIEWPRGEPFPPRGSTWPVHYHSQGLELFVINSKETGDGRRLAWVKGSE